ncbi:MAG: fused response regulator/phosphatase [Gemmatimonadaceae bacterium]
MTAPSGSTILVVDDNELNRDILTRRLQRSGHVVEVAEHGVRALEMMAATSFDLVMLDIMMPEMNGYEVLARLKADPRLQHVPVIMITAVDDEESIVRCIELGAEDHMPKPFNPALLKARVASSLAKKQLHDREQTYAAGLQRELDIGRRIQEGFLPEHLPEAEGWELRACFVPARQVAGDFYDAFPLPGEKIAFVVADVCDKGVGAALFMAIFRSLFRALAEQRFMVASPADAPSAALLDVVTATNDYIGRTHASANMFATVFFGVLDPVTGHIWYVNGGHEAPIILGAGGAERVRLAPTGPAVGMMPDLQFHVAEASLGVGELLVAYTDGVLDAHDAAGAMFGEERMLASARSSPASALDAIQRALADFSAGVAAYDDVTMLSIRRVGVANG